VADRPRSLTGAALLAGLALAAPFWVGRFVPLLDLPQHLALVAVLRHHGDPAWGFARHFATEWGELTPYWTYYAVTYVLSLVFSVETASRVYLSLYALVFPWAGIELARAFGRSPWLGLLAAPLALNTTLYYGFISYGTGVVLALLLIADLERGLSAPRFPWVRHALGGALLFFTHVQPFAFYLAAGALLAAARRDVPWPMRARRGAAMLPAALGLLLPWLYLQVLAPRDATARYTFGRVGRMGATFQPPLESLRGLPRAIAGSFQDRSDLVLLAVWAALAAAALLPSGGERRPMRALGPLLLAGAAYFLAPISVTGQWNIGPRFALLAALFVPAVARATGARAAGIGAAAAALSLAVGVNAARVHAAFDREAGPVDAALDAIPRGARVMPLVFENRGQVLEPWPYLHFGQYAMVRRGGVTAANLGRFPPFPIRLLDPEALPALDAFRPGDFRCDTMGSAYDAFFVRGTPPAGLLPGAQVEVLFAGGDWTVYAPRRRALAPVPGPCPSLREAECMQGLAPATP
jgi:hypothetical protein